LIVDENMHKRYLAVIPARGGSKRLPGKNVMKIGEHSLIGYAIEGVKHLEPIAEICVTTDDQEIADETLKYGPYVHFKRPDYLASDEAKTFDVVFHAIQWFRDQGTEFDAVVLLQPTSPLRTKQHIREAIQRFEKHDAQAVVSVCRLEHPLEWCAQLGPDGSMEAFGKNLGAQKRSQDLAATFRLNGSIYIYDIASLLKNNGFFYNDQTYAYEMDTPSSTDVDTHEDFLLATFWKGMKSKDE
jgi:CMP-N-acetylneuraminic acid synthetase